MKKETNIGEKLFLDHADKCLEIIEQAAVEISLIGVAVVAFIPGDNTTTWISKMKVVGALTNSMYNFLAVAYSKAAEIADTHKDSGLPNREIKIGELGYPGGLVKKVNSGYLIAVFSGGTGEQDAAAANEGLDWLSKYWQSEY
jgi:hypothetical protein